MNERPASMDLVLARLDDLTRRLDGMRFSPWHTTAEAARYLRCSISHIERLTREAQLPFKRQNPTNPKSPRLYHRRDLVGYLVTGKNPETHPLTREEKRMVNELL